MPAWLAWESFGDKNGTDTFAEMAARIEAIRRRILHFERSLFRLRDEL